MTQVLQAKFLVPSKAGSTGSCYTTHRHLQGDGRHLPTWFSLFLHLPLDANNSILLSLPHRWASPLWAMETCTPRPTWAGSSPSSALLLHHHCKCQHCEKDKDFVLSWREFDLMKPLKEFHRTQLKNPWSMKTKKSLWGKCNVAERIWNHNNLNLSPNSISN